MTKLDQVKLQRDTAVAKLKRIEDYIKSYTSNSSVNQLNARLIILNEIRKNFEEVQSEIELLDKTASAAEHIQTRIEIEDRLCNAMSDINDIIDNATPGSNSVSTPVSGNSLNQNDESKDFLNLKLPVLNLKAFSGNYKEWLNFENSFKSVIDETKSAYIALRELLDTLTTNLSALKSLNIPIDYWDALIVPIINEKLDYATKREWQISVDIAVPTYEHFKNFLEKRCSVLESLNVLSYNRAPNNVNNSVSKAPQVSNKSRTVTHLTTQKSFLCVLCKGSSHNITHCEDFQKLDANEKLRQVKRLNLCTNCLRDNHQISNCRSKINCRTCSKKHNSLLHTDENAEEANLTLTSYAVKTHSSPVLLSTAIILIKNSKGEYEPCRAFLDVGSMSHYITESMVKRLNLNPKKIKIEIKCLNGVTSSANREVKINIKSRYNAFASELNCLVVGKITENLPLVSLSPQVVDIPKNIKLADPYFYESSEVDMLIGAGQFLQLLCVGQIRSSAGIIFQKTQLGFIAGGTFNNCLSTRTAKTSCNVSLEMQVQRFLEIEAVNNKDLNTLTAPELACEAHFVETTKRDTEGRFIIRLPLKGNKLNLGDTKTLALRRFYSLERGLLKNTRKKDEYSKFMREYRELNHMECVTEVQEGAYLSHHAVINENSSTSRLRVVFDASAKSSNNLSLNDNLMAGPVIQQDLFSIVVRFRTWQFCLSGDITKMYRQILIHPDEANYQLIFWRDHPNENLKTYRLKTLTYGTRPASFIATRCLKELSKQNEVDYPKASEIVARDFYIDDLLCGSNFVNELINIKNEVIDILKHGQFELRKLKSNKPSIVPVSETSDSIVYLDKGECKKTLGLHWNPTHDNLRYDIDLNAIPKKITKRTILSTTAKIFDPLGLVGPIIMQAKIILQQLWTLKLGWDESVPANIHTLWCNFLKELHHLYDLIIPRKIIACFPYKQIELIGFCDASQVGYGACLYIRASKDNHSYESRLLCAKSRVAPLKTITLPRLELCGAVLLANLVKKVRLAITLEISREILWTDSSIVLAWINSQSASLKTFVANRINEIQSLTAQTSWRHVKSENNAADILSRGTSAKELVKNELWFSGPSFLKQPEHCWPQSSINVNKTDVPEIRVTALAATSDSTTVKEPTILAKYSCYEKLQRILAWIFRFTYNSNKNKNNGDKLKGNLSIQELQGSAAVIARLVQKSEFESDIKCLKSSRPLSKKSKLLSLDPFIDKFGLIRVGGRLKNASIARDAKHPVILPKNHFVTKLIIKHEHERQLHAGPQATLAAIRQRHWIIDGRNVTRQVLHKCMKCFKANPKAGNPKMGDLPIHRVQPSRPFLITGTDYAGPVLVKESRGRGRRLVKAYIALFICFATKAAHIELVSDLSTEEFLGALKRFIGRRGHPTDIYSDNATNFVGANNELKELAEFFKKDDVKNSLDNQMSKIGIKWHFTPPKAPHMGGLWESNIKSIKRHLKRTVGNAHLTFTEMYTFLVKIEACLNSRPLIPLSSDPSDLQTLTPGHFLIGQPLTELPEYDLSGVPESRLTRWQLVERIRSHFWKRWSKEYITQLQTRSKWPASSTSSLKVGEMVILNDDGSPPLTWRIGRIIETHPGDDGNVRVVTVRTNQGVFKRAVHKVFRLPIE